MPKRLKLVNLILQRFCINHEQATKVVLEVKVKNGGVLRGIKISRFFRIASQIISEKYFKKTPKPKPNKKTRRTCPLCYKLFKKKYNRDRHMQTVHSNTLDCIDDRDADDFDENSIGSPSDVASIVGSIIDSIIRDAYTEQKKNSKVTCPECGKSFLSRSNLKRHADKHKEDRKSYGCWECEFETTRSDTLKKHLKNVHSKFYKNISAIRAKDENNLVCEMCGESFEGNPAYENHIIYEACLKPMENINNEGRFQCDRCECSYSSKDSLTRHINWKHTSSIIFSCDTCEKIFYNDYSLRRHESKKH